jgi:uncharacterized repeat protein (TIGR03899 family)
MKKSMKISSQETTPNIRLDASPDKKEVKTEPKPVIRPATAPKETVSPSHLQIKYWFGKVGVQSSYAQQSAKQRHETIIKRRQLKESLKLDNLTAIMEIALNVSVGNEKSEAVDPDWFHAFTHLAENVYSPTMQELWGKIFAVEVNHPGTFSLRTLETLKVLTQKDAKLFELAASIASRSLGDNTPKILTGYHQRPGLLLTLMGKQHKHINLAAHGLSYPNLLTLIDMKLIVASEIETSELDPEQIIKWKVGAETLNLQPKRKGLALAYYKFTMVGAELYKLVGRHHSPNYAEDVKAALSRGFYIR